MYLGTRIRRDVKNHIQGPPSRLFSPLSPHYDARLKFYRSSRRTPSPALSSLVHSHRANCAIDTMGSLGFTGILYVIIYERSMLGPKGGCCRYRGNWRRYARFYEWWIANTTYIASPVDARTCDTCIRIRGEGVVVFIRFFFQTPERGVSEKNEKKRVHTNAWWRYSLYICIFFFLLCFILSQYRGSFINVSIGFGGGLLRRQEVLAWYAPPRGTVDVWLARIVYLYRFCFVVFFFFADFRGSLVQFRWIFVSFFILVFQKNGPRVCWFRSVGSRYVSIESKVVFRVEHGAPHKRKELKTRAKKVVCTSNVACVKKRAAVGGGGREEATHSTHLESSSYAPPKSWLFLFLTQKPGSLKKKLKMPPADKKSHGIGVMK